MAVLVGVGGTCVPQEADAVRSHQGGGVSAGPGWSQASSQV